MKILQYKRVRKLILFVIPAMAVTSVLSYLALRHSEVRDMAIEFVKTSDDVRSITGDIYDLHVKLYGSNLNNIFSGGNAKYIVELKGDHGTYRVSVYMLKRDYEWWVREYTIEEVNEY